MIKSRGIPFPQVPQEPEKIKILFLTADPSDASRLRVGEELRDIRERLQLSNYRERFVLESRESARPPDISLAFQDIKPYIVHFSGHGLNTGELCFEDLQGKMQPVKPEALASLFKLVEDQVRCVVLNACYSEIQAKAISQHIPFVIGMNKAIGDRAAITFSTGFYQALGGGYDFNKAYEFGCCEIQLQGISEHLIPVLYRKNDENANTIQNRRRYRIRIDISLDKIDASLLLEIIEKIRCLSGDISLTLRQIQKGSIILEIEGSEDGFKRLEALLKSGQLKEVMGLPVQDLCLLNNDENVFFINTDTETTPLPDSSHQQPHTKIQRQGQGDGTSSS